MQAIPCRASEVVCTRLISSEPNWDLKLCCGALVSVLRGGSGLTSEDGGSWGDSDGFWNDVGQLGPASCQFGESEHCVALSSGWCGSRSL